jgi:chemotaxis protein histidine kinase CheA
MASGRPDVITYGDHELITPDSNKLRKTLRPALPGEQDPVAGAEEALAAISGDFSNWMQDECARLDAARCKVREQGLSRQTRQELFLAAHDVKGGSGTLGYPEVGATADSLCRLLEHAPDLNKIPLVIIDQHVDAVRAIVREHGRADIAAIAAAVTSKLRAVTDEFLIKENHDRPDVLKTIQSPALEPGDSF